MEIANHTKDTIKNFDEIYNEYYRRCFLFAKSYLHDEYLAKDIASESMIALWTAMKTEDIQNIQAFLMTIIRNNSLNYLSHERMKADVHEDLLSNELYELDFRISTLESCNPEKLFLAEVRTILNNTLQTLPEQTRKAFEMSRYERKSVKEIAQKMNLSVKGVDYHIGKATKALRISLKDYLPLLSSMWMIQQ